MSLDWQVRRRGSGEVVIPSAERRSASNGTPLLEGLKRHHRIREFSMTFIISVDCTGEGCKIDSTVPVVRECL
jgi:hypothetical protein